MQESHSASLRNRLAHQVRDIPRSGIRDFFDIVSTMKDVISLGIGEPDFDTPWHVRESTVFSLERGATHYTSNLGYLELPQALSKYIRYIYPDYIEELYDLASDPDELKNLAVREAHHARLAEFREQLVKAFAAKGASFVELLPPPRIATLAD